MAKIQKEAQSGSELERRRLELKDKQHREEMKVGKEDKMRDDKRTQTQIEAELIYLLRRLELTDADHYSNREVNASITSGYCNGRIEWRHLPNAN